MRFFSDRHNDYENIHPENFPHIFAVCRGITQQPQFQILRIERIRGYDEYATYRFINEPFESDEYNLFHDGNPEQSMYGQMEVYRPPPNPNERIIRLRFQIRNIFLASRHEVFPVILLDTLEAIPPADAVIIPRNVMNIQEYFHSQYDPNFINNFIMDHGNFRPVENPGFHRVLNRYFRRREQGRGNDWFDHPADIYEGHDDYSPRRSRDVTPIIAPHPFRGGGSGGAAAGAGGGSSSRTRRDSTRAQTPPPPAAVRLVPAPAPAAAPTVARPVNLQAFTITALINHAVSEHMTCPISMNAIQKSTACVTSCQHIFERESIQHWLADHSNCPVCRQPTSICN